MLTVNKLIAQGRGLATVLTRRAATVELGWEIRQRSRFEAADSTGRRLDVALPRGSVVRGGDVLVAEDGTLVVVKAAPQPVMVVRHCTEHGMPGDLLRAAYHLGSRHVAVQLRPDHLQLEPDPALGAMLRRMHLIVSEEQAAFEPESGDEPAHPHGAHENHHHDHARHHAHDHHDHGHDHHDHAHHHGHAHQGRDHGHDHGHDHPSGGTPDHKH
ncbi:MAG: urease accessory protein UreE [Rubrivivax sp.]|nr:urease accessory protein UreE [Rubrivivax sp.]